MLLSSAIVILGRETLLVREELAHQFMIAVGDLRKRDRNFN
jgi:hypothetical protein